MALTSLSQLPIEVRGDTVFPWEKGGKRSTLKHKEKVHTYFLTRKPCGVVFFSHRAPPLSVDVFISSDSM